MRYPLVFRVARVVAPKKAALKEAEAELAVAMEVRVYAFILFPSCICMTLTQPTPPCSHVLQVGLDTLSSTRKGYVYTNVGRVALYF